MGQQMLTVDFAGTTNQPQRLPGPVCTGPHCQRDQHIPAAPTKAVQVPTFTDAILATMSAIQIADTFLFSQPTDIDQVTGLAGRIFRPPRAA